MNDDNTSYASLEVGHEVDTTAKAQPVSVANSWQNFLASSGGKIRPQKKEKILKI